MEPIAAFADRAALLSLRLLAALHALLFLSFVLALLSLAGRAHAQGDAAGSADLATGSLPVH